VQKKAEALLFDWNFWARGNQRAPEGNWASWLILAGRGFGKTRVGAEMVRHWVQNFAHVNLIGATAADARDIMIEGESGILAVCPRHERPHYAPSKRRLKMAEPRTVADLYGRRAGTAAWQATHQTVV
jgi:phage terminase large subunit-like protein